MKSRRKTLRPYWTVLLAAVLSPFVIAASTATEEPENTHLSSCEAAEKFDLVYQSVQASATILGVADSEASAPNVPSRSITISARLDIHDTNDLVAIDVSNLAIMEVLDEDGSVIACQTNSSSGVRQYQEVRWVTEWEGTHNFERLQPSRLSAEVKLAANQPMPSSISLLRVSMYALYAEGVIEVDVPFEVSGDAIEAAPDLEILLLPDTPPRPGPIQYEPVGPGDSRADPRRPTAPISLYKYRTHVKSMAGKPVFGLWDRYPWNLGNGFTLGDYVVVGTQLVDSRKRIRYRFSDQGVISDPWGDHGAECWGKVEQTAYDFDTIRHIIAVRPYEVKVPFALSDIPIPTLDPASQ